MYLSGADDDQKGQEGADDADESAAAGATAAAAAGDTEADAAVANGLPGMLKHMRCEHDLSW